MDYKPMTITRTPQAPAAAYPRRWAAAIVMMIAALMDLIDVTIVNVALPTIRRDLHASGTQLEWVISAYLLAFAVTLITAGRLGDLLGRKKLFLTRVAGFGLASLACALAPNAGLLIAARAVQGAGAAVMVPQVLATYRAIFTGKERGAVFGMYGAGGGLATALGLLLGGVLVSADIFGWHWRSVFAVEHPHRGGRSDRRRRDRARDPPGPGAAPRLPWPGPAVRALVASSTRCWKARRWAGPPGPSS